MHSCQYASAVHGGHGSSSELHAHLQARRFELAGAPMAPFGLGTPQNPAQGSLSPSIIVISISAIQGVALPIRQRLHSALTNRHPNQPPNPHPRTHPLRHRPSPALPNTSLPDSRSRLGCSRTLFQGVSTHLDTGRSPPTHPPQHDHCLSALRVAQRSHQSSAAQWRCTPPTPATDIPRH